MTSQAHLGPKFRGSCTESHWSPDCHPGCPGHPSKSSWPKPICIILHIPRYSQIAINEKQAVPAQPTKSHRHSRTGVSEAKSENEGKYRRDGIEGYPIWKGSRIYPCDGGMIFCWFERRFFVMLTRSTTRYSPRFIVVLVLVYCLSWFVYCVRFTPRSRLWWRTGCSSRSSYRIERHCGLIGLGWEIVGSGSIGRCREFVEK